MDRRGSVARRLDTRVIMTWVKMNLCLISILMLKNLILTCLSASGVLVRCLTYFTLRVLKSEVSSTRMYKIAYKIPELSWTHMVVLEYLTAVWTISSLKKGTLISHNVPLHTSSKEPHSKLTVN